MLYAESMLTLSNDMIYRFVSEESVGEGSTPAGV